jgi:hypothetical protein
MITSMDDLKMEVDVGVEFEKMGFQGEWNQGRSI